jgi:hypothetical protein
MICRAGCSMTDVLATLGLSFRDISPATPRTKVPDVVRRAQNAARSSMPRNLPAAIRQQPVTVIYTDEIHINEAIARALALVVVNRELVQIVLRGSA